MLSLIDKLTNTTDNIHALETDLQNLLNTHQLFFKSANDYPELSESFINYGLPTIKKFDKSNQNDCQKFQSIIKDIIETYEPRLKNVQVSIDSEKETNALSLSFNIHADYLTSPEPVAVNFNSMIEPMANKIKVMEINHE